MKGETMDRNICPEGIDAKDVRAWAVENGYTVKGRGRLAAEVIDAYVAYRESVPF